MTTATTIRTTWTIEYGDHDRGAHSGALVRGSRERALWTADLLRQCGYRDVRIHPTETR